ncbi:allantoate amidohydrolase [Nocardia sp. R7R-8]|uniref:allantoate amidohydrolase n=1 Tax=Nocardia sp. R7R-8 TaxID=3459304 RepID=UPI00403DEC7F
MTTTFDSMWGSLLPVGRDSTTGGYRRFAWNDADMTLREWFIDSADKRGMSVEEDRNGNLWAWWMPPAWTGDPKDAFVTGSHLDSVPDGGAFDGPLGVVSAFAAIDLIRARGIVPTRPIAVTAFSDEEGARFGVACVGSQLSTGALKPERALALRDADGVTLAEALERNGRKPHHVGVDPGLTDRVGVFVELHVEQGRALDLLDRPIAVAATIWPHGRWLFTYSGEANHAGTTRIVDRADPMLAYASSVHSARIAATAHDAVATFGKLCVLPNGANAIPSEVKAWLDARAADEATLTALVEQISAEARRHADNDGIDLDIAVESITPIVTFPATVRDTLRNSLSAFGEVPILPTAAGHDAGILSAKVPTAMIFVRNPSGVSHSPHEFARAEDCRLGTEALADVMADWATT